MDSNTLPNKARILLVDDDPISLMMLKTILTQEGYLVATAINGKEAFAEIQKVTSLYFDALITDYLMPQMDGLSLMKAVRKLDTTLAIIMITSDSERETLSASLRGGVLDFLEKPVSREDLTRAVKRAVRETADLRSMQDAQQRLTTVASISDRLAPDLDTGNIGEIRSDLLTRIFPIYEAGGDFLSVSHHQDAAVHLVLGDVSGHGLLEGFIAAYFQGMVKGMQALGATPLQIAQECNRFLLKDWMARAGDSLPSSLSALFVDLDLDARRLHVLNCGCPAVQYFEPGQPIRPLASTGGSLGWFESFNPGAIAIDVPTWSSLLIWSDGLPDYALLLGVHPEALATHILLSTQGVRPVVMENHPSPDDVLVSRLRWFPSDGLVPVEILPVYNTQFLGNLGQSIDLLQESLRKNLFLAFPLMSISQLDAICLCAREACLNAAAHGCKGNAELTAHLLVEYHGITSPFLRVIVNDPGSGYEPYKQQPLPDLLTGKGHISLGLSLIKSMAKEVRHFRNGARIEMDFPLTD